MESTVNEARHAVHDTEAEIRKRIEGGAGVEAAVLDVLQGIARENRSVHTMEGSVQDLW